MIKYIKNIVIVGGGRGVLGKNDSVFIIEL